ncbi:MAG: copper chaperone PCu(A)C [Acidimicrobiales bacterium]|nr:copper chaperone PCu(A)C [Acidimicrobiales bacterium]
MRSPLRPRLAAIVVAIALAVAALAVGCGDEPEPTGTLVVRDVTIDEPINGTTAAVRMVVDNADGPADRLVGAETDVAGLTMLHESMTDDEGRATMADLDAIEIPQGERVYFVPGTYHVMLADLQAPLEVGDEVDLELRFERAGTVRVTATVTELGVVGDTPGE